MAKLGPDDQDIEWLEDANDFEAFSQVLYAENGVEGRPQVCNSIFRKSTYEITVPGPNTDVTFPPDMSC